MTVNKLALFASGLAAAGLLVGGATLASADTGTTASTTPTAAAPASPGTGTDSDGGACGGRGPGGGGGTQDTPVTGDAAQRVIDAVRAKDSGATITEVRQDPDGSYDALGTKADGSRVFYEVSADLATVTENTGPGGQAGPHGRGGPGDLQQGDRTKGDPQADQGQGGTAQAQPSRSTATPAETPS